MVRGNSDEITKVKLITESPDSVCSSFMITNCDETCITSLRFQNNFKTDDIECLNFGQ